MGGLGGAQEMESKEPAQKVGMDLGRTRVTDHDGLEAGQWREHPYYDGLQVRVRSIHSKTYRERLRMLQNRENVRRARKVGDAVASQVEIEMRALPSVLTDWKGIREDDREVPYSEEFARSMAEEWISDHQSHRRFWDGVSSLAHEIGEGEAEAARESLGN